MTDETHTEKTLREARAAFEEADEAERSARYGVVASTLRPSLKHVEAVDARHVALDAVIMAARVDERAKIVEWLRQQWLVTPKDYTDDLLQDRLKDAAQQIAGGARER